MSSINPNHDDWMLIYDNAALWFANEVAVEYDYGMIPCTKDLKNKGAKLGQIKDAINAGLFFMTDRCKNLSIEMQNYVKDKNGKIPKENDHLIDAIRYIYNGSHYDFTRLPEPVEVSEDY